MTIRCLFCLFVLSVSLAYGQLDSNTITVTASRNAALQPDQVVFGVNVTSGLDKSLDDIVAALAGIGITSANFSGVSALLPVAFPLPSTGPTVTTVTLPPPTISWNFTLAAPFSKMKDTVTALLALQKSIAKDNSGLTLSFSVQGTQVSPQLQQMQTCSVSDLLSDARAQAQKLASAATLFLGPVLAMSSSTFSNTPLSAYASNVFYSAPNCSLTVQFGVTR